MTTAQCGTNATNPHVCFPCTDLSYVSQHQQATSECLNYQVKQDAPLLAPLTSQNNTLSRHRWFFIMIRTRYCVRYLLHTSLIPDTTCTPLISVASGGISGSRCQAGLTRPAALTVWAHLNGKCVRLGVISHGLPKRPRPSPSSRGLWPCPGRKAALLPGPHIHPPSPHISPPR